MLYDVVCKLFCQRYHFGIADEICYEKRLSCAIHINILGIDYNLCIIQIFCLQKALVNVFDDFDNLLSCFFRSDFGHFACFTNLEFNKSFLNSLADSNSVRETD